MWTNSVILFVTSCLEFKYFKILSGFVKKQIHICNEAPVCGFLSFFSVSTQDDSATGNVDYNTETQSVTFLPTEVLKNVVFDIINDERIEETESFKVTLTAVSSQVTLGSVNEHTIQIIDDDCKYF